MIQQLPRLQRILIGLTAILAVVALLWGVAVATVVTIPFAFSLFLFLLLHPIQRRIAARVRERWGWLSVAGPMLLLVLVVGLGGVCVSWIGTKAIDQAGQYGSLLQGTLSQARDMAESYGLPLGELQMDGQLLKNWATRGFSSALSFLTAAVLTFFLVLLMLMEAHHWRNKVHTAFRDEHSADILDTVEIVAVKVRQYLWVRFLLSVMSTVATAVFLLLMGVDLWYLWAALTFLLNFVPNVGSIISVIPPTAMAFVQFGTGWGLAVLGGLTVIEQIIGNYLDPLMQGQRLVISPTVVLLAVIFWSWLWGAAGALLAVPMTVAAIISCGHVPALQPIAILLSREDYDGPQRRKRGWSNAAAARTPGTELQASS